MRWGIPTTMAMVSVAYLQHEPLRPGGRRANHSFAHADALILAGAPASIP